MTLGDEIAISIGGIAIGGTAVLLVVLALGRSRWSSIEPDELDEVPIRIRFTDEPAWRIESVLDRRTVVVDTFTYRCRDEQRPGPWHHELMDGAIRLLPGQSARLAAPANGVHWDAAAGWAVLDDGGPRRGSQYLHAVRCPG